MAMLEAPLESIDAYANFFARQKFPVLRSTLREFELLRTQQDKISGKRLASVVLGDPLMTMKVLTHLQANRPKQQNHDITTIDRAIMMMGVTPFFDRFSDMTTVEDTLRAHPKALIGVLKVIARARKAAHFARDWAIVRHDLDVDEVTIAALLVEVVEIMCWVFAPALTLKVQDIQRPDPAVRTAEAERAVFGATTREIQIALARTSKLPELLIALMDEANAGNPRVRNVNLAADLTRHLSHGWTNAALPDDINNIEKLLHIAREPLMDRLSIPIEERHRFLATAD